ncbi:MAG: hypothetical protein NTU57_03190 [Candidatus Aenigmarchaeota archaeon]|nr:hypothetical protein [Candidatus Aenigmarchaeota archaeon]
MDKDKNRAMAAVFLVFISCVLITISFSSITQVSAAVNIEKTWDCSSGFSCGSNTMGLCTSTLKPYLSMFNNQYSFSLAVEKPGAYTCTVKVTANHFDFPDGKTDEPNEVTDVSLNGITIGSTVDSWCQPGSVPCVNPDVCTTCLSYGCTQKYNGDCPDGCRCPCKTPSESGNSMNALQSSSGSFGGSICFNIKNLNALINSAHRDGEGAVIAFSSPNNRQYFAIIHGIGGSILFHRFGFCFACSCTNWCGVGGAGTITAREGVTYKIQKTGPYTLAFSDGTTTLTYNAANDNDNGATIQQKFRNGIELSQYCVGSGCAWNGHPFFPFVDGNAAIEIVDCSIGVICDNDGTCDVGENPVNCPNDCGGNDGECKNMDERCSISAGDCCTGLICIKVGPVNRCVPAD